ncbi:MAG: glycosyltransferase family 1 protein [Kiritimatiellae bacterium]|nr:glycosyltransferase family 1 protein [Kiritimatiellia bacterium]
MSTYYTTPPVGLPSVCVVYDMIMERYPELFTDDGAKKLVWQKRQAIKQAERVLCISENTQKDVIELTGVSRAKCLVVYPAPFVTSQSRVDAESVAETNREPFLLYVGDYHTPHKNFSFLLKSLGSVLTNELPFKRLIVVSPVEPTSSDLKSFAGLIRPERLEFITDCDDRKLMFFYKTCTAFVYPSLYEGFGIPVVEALSCGAPVVCSNTSSLPEVGGDAVYYFNPTSVDDFAVALKKALSDGRTPEKLLQRIGQTEKFSWDKTALVFLEVLENVTTMHTENLNRKI